MWSVRETLRYIPYVCMYVTNQWKVDFTSDHRHLTGFLLQRMMERASHINIAMIEDIGTNGMARSKVVDQIKQPCGSTVSFHNIQYKVQLKSGSFCKRKTSPREILVDLKSVAKIVHPLYLFACSSVECLSAVSVPLSTFLYIDILITNKLKYRHTQKCCSCCRKTHLYRDLQVFIGQLLFFILIYSHTQSC